MAKKYTLKQLVSAIENNKATLVETILDSGDVNIGKQSAKLLRCAIENDNFDSFALLIKNDQLDLTAGKHIAIKLCIELERDDMMNALLKTSAFNTLSATALYNFFKKAAELEHHNITKALVNTHGDTFQLSTALSWVFKKNLVIPAKQLLKISNDKLPLGIIKQALKENLSIEFLSILIHSGRFDVQKIFEWSIEVTPSLPLELIKILITHSDVDPSIKENHILSEMIKIGNGEIVKLLLAHPKVDPADQNNFAIRRAAFYNRIEIMKLLLTITDKGINPNVEDYYCLRTAAGQDNLEMVQLLLPYCSIHRIKLFNVLKSDTENLSQEILDYFEFPESYIAAQSKFTQAQKLAFTILEFKKNIQEWERKKEEALINDEENAMNDESVIRAKTTFERKVQPAFSDAFFAYADKNAENKELSAILNVEQKIRECILDAVLASTPQQETLSFIQENKAELIKATDAELMKQTREHHFNSNSNLHHLAWRGYDANAPYKGHFDNLLTPPKKVRAVFTTPASKIDDNTLLNTTASLAIRKMVAHYYLLATSSEFIAETEQTLTDENKKQIIAERIANFISELADMRSAHSDDYHGRPDAPSCYPGYLGRVANMGFKHPLTQETISTKNFVADRIESNIFTIFKQQLDSCTTEIDGQQLLSAVTLLTETGWRAQNIFIGQEKYEKEHLSIRENFIQALGTQEQSLAKINQELENANRSTLTELSQTNGINEQSYVFQYLTDPARGKLSGKFSAEYLRWVKKFQVIEKTEDHLAIEEKKSWYNPYTSSVTQINNLLLRLQNSPGMALIISKRLKNAETKLALFNVLQELVTKMSFYKNDIHDMACYILFTETLTEAVFENLQQENIDDFSLFSYHDLPSHQLKAIHNDVQQKLADKSDHDAFAGAFAISEAFTAPEMHLSAKTPSFMPQFQGIKTPPLSPSKHNQAMMPRSPLKQNKARQSPARRSNSETPLF